MEFRPCEREIVTIHVSGREFQTYVSTLERYPNSLLGDPKKRIRFKDPTTGALFFDRHSGAFEYILYFYQSEGTIHCPKHIPISTLIDEATFFQLSPDAIHQFKLNNGLSEPTVSPEMPSLYPLKAMWEFLEYPESSLGARVYTLMQICVIMISLFVFVMESMPQFSQPVLLQRYDNKVIDDNICRTNSDFKTSCMENLHGMVREQRFINEVTESNCTRIKIEICRECVGYVRKAEGVCKFIQKDLVLMNPHERGMHIVNTAVIVWFSAEFILRSLVCPNKLKYFLAPETMVDLLSILPYYLALVVGSADGNSRVLSVIRVVRVLRVFKLSRHSSSLQILIKTVVAVRAELAILFFFLTIKVNSHLNMIIFDFVPLGSLIFEHHQNNKKSFPSLISLTDISNYYCS